MAPATWDAAADRQLLLAIIQTTNPTPSWPVIGRMIGKTSESARQHYAKLKKENASTTSPNDGSDEANDAGEDADSNSDPALASNIKPLQAPKRKRAPKDTNKAPPAKRGKKTTTTTADPEESEETKPRTRTRKAVAAKSKTLDDDDDDEVASDHEIDAEGGALKEEEEEEDADDVPAPVPKTKETKPRATRAKKATATKEAKPRATRTTRKTTVAALQTDGEDEPDAEVAEEELIPEPGMLAAYAYASRSRTGGFRGGERKIAFEKQKMVEVEMEQQQQQQKVLENINVGFEAGGEEGVDDVSV